MAAPVVPNSFQIYNSYVEDPKWQIKFTITWCSGIALAVAVSIPSVILGLRHGRSLKGIAGISETDGYQSAHSDGREPPPTTFLLAYLTAVFVCIIQDAPLISDPNRAGFLALPQFPVVFLFAIKNSILSLLLGPGNGHEKLNFIHGMAGRAMFLAAYIHGFLWIRNRLQYELAILGPHKETSGVASLDLLCIIVLTSLRPVRRLFHECHILTYVASVVAMCYHTPYASPLRVLFSNRVFESHPFTILSAPPSHSCLSSPGFLLAVRNDGDWTRALNSYTQGEQERLRINNTSEGDSGTFVQVMLDGPYGGSSVDLGLYESAFLIAGGSGVTFTLGLLDDIVGRCVRLGRSQGERTRRIEFIWCIRSFGQIEWFTAMLIDIATAASNSTIDLHIYMIITCSQACDPEAVLHIPNSIVALSRLAEDSINMQCDESQKLTGLGGGVAVRASDPESLTRDAQNAVARLGLTMGMDVGGIGLHTEQFTL
ncbi:hypothetical protein BDR06DRAFT_985290 [Suillus hirtellus]|nr:hypothetical protein BDR06DRAFT_985290 [Suillus hirtellus]